MRVKARGRCAVFGRRTVIDIVITDINTVVRVLHFLKHNDGEYKKTDGSLLLRRWYKGDGQLDASTSDSRATIMLRRLLLLWFIYFFFFYRTRDDARTNFVRNRWLRNVVRIFLFRFRFWILSARTDDAVFLFPRTLFAEGALRSYIAAHTIPQNYGQPAIKTVLNSKLFFFGNFDCSSGSWSKNGRNFLIALNDLNFRFWA